MSFFFTNDVFHFLLFSGFCTFSIQTGFILRDGIWKMPLRLQKLNWNPFLSGTTFSWVADLNKRSRSGVMSRNSDVFARSEIDVAVTESSGTTKTFKQKVCLLLFHSLLTSFCNWCAIWMAIWNPTSCDKLLVRFLAPIGCRVWKTSRKTKQWKYINQCWSYIVNVLYFRKNNFHLQLSISRLDATLWGTQFCARFQVWSLHLSLLHSYILV